MSGQGNLPLLILWRNEIMQKTILIEYKGTQVVSQPFTFKHACLVDDERYRDGGLATGARTALVKMFEGTILTEEKIDTEIDIKVLKKAINKILDMYLGIDVEIKNLSSPQPEQKEDVGV
jgi:hypothetical protein